MNTESKRSFLSQKKPARCAHTIPADMKGLTPTAQEGAICSLHCGGEQGAGKSGHLKPEKQITWLLWIYFSCAYPQPSTACFCHLCMILGMEQE